MLTGRMDRRDDRSLYEWLISIEAERCVAEARLAKVAAELTEARMQVRLAEAVAAAREEALRELIDHLRAELRSIRQSRPWWRRVWGG